MVWLLCVDLAEFRLVGLERFDGFMEFGLVSTFAGELKELVDWDRKPRQFHVARIQEVRSGRCAAKVRLCDGKSKRLTTEIADTFLEPEAPDFIAGREMNRLGT